MKRRDFIASAGTISLGLGVSALAPAAKNPPEDSPPNILFIITDQQHSLMMSCTGNEWLKTPAMDSLARGGIRFEKAYAANPVCLPSRTSMATGVMPGRLGVFDNGMNAKVPGEVDENSLGKLIKRAGYDTFYGGKVHMCKELTPIKAGYDEFDPDPRDLLPAACAEFIAKKRQRPFFAVASFINPHDICFAYSAHIGKVVKGKSSVDDLYREASNLPPDKLPPLPENYPIPKNEAAAIESYMNPKAVTPAITMRKDYDERQWRIYRWIYCRLTERVDGEIGRILDALRQSGQEKRTLIVFTSDHGNMDASHHLASKNLFYEESSGIPFIMQYKGRIPAGQVDKTRLVSNGLDILPTLCDYAGVAAPKTLLGKSLRDVAEGKTTAALRPFVVSENNTGRMIRSQRFKYCVYADGDNRESLIDMQSDPGEMKNLATNKKYQKQLNEHRRHLALWIKESRDEEAKAFAIPEKT